MDDARLLERIEALAAENALLKEQITHLERESGIDPLTGIANRRAFDRELAESFKLAHGQIEEHRAGARLFSEVALTLFDLDHFKQVNDTRGHAAGDAVLRAVAGAARASVRKGDTLARVGGEEFAVIMRGVTPAAAAHSAEHLREKIAALSFALYPGLRITASFGIASSGATATGEELYTLADEALYASKQGGRNRVSVTHA